jgi:Tol biopolymer transport system component
MASDRWRQVESLYHAALARPAGERAAFLAEACGDDAEMRAEVESLIAQVDGASSFLESPAMIDEVSPLSLVGRQLGAYRIDAPVGAGGMGEVYRAKDTRLGRDVAVKILPAAWVTDPQRRSRFEREARAIAALNHPHICTIHDVGHDAGVDFLVMELLEGRTLAARLARGPLPLTEALARAIEIADALSKAHRQGIIHRDVKPGNVMLTKSGAKLLDFGLARLVRDEPTTPTSDARTNTAPLTEAGAVLGTLQYMAPEQLEGRQVDARTDIWAFGCVLYEMVSGRRAFTASSDAGLISAILTSEARPLASSPLDRPIRKCLAKDPDRRWQTAADLTDELRWIGGWSAESGSSAPVSDATRRGRVPRWRLLRLAPAALALAAVGIAAGYFLHPAPEVRYTRFDIQPPLRTVWGNGGLAISPDGRRVAFVAVSGGKSSIWIREVNDTRTRNLAGTDGADIYLFWSPDGTSLGFFADKKLKTIPSNGGPVLSLADAPRPGGGTWNRDDVIVFAPDVVSNRGLLRVPADGGPVGPLTALDAGDGDGGYRAPVFLPDGRHLLFVSRSGIHATSLADPGHRVRVLNEASSVQFASGHLLFVSNGSLWARPFDPSALALSGEATRIADDVDWPRDLTITRASAKRGQYEFSYEFSASEAGLLVYRTLGREPVRQFVWLDRGGREASRLPITGALASPVLSPDGTRLTFSMDSSGNRDIYVVLDIEHPVPRKLSFDAGSDSWPAWFV